MTDRPLSELLTISKLFAVIVKWADSQGAVDLKDVEGLWKGETIAAAGLGPLTIKINGHYSKTIEGVPPLNAAIEVCGYPLGMFDPIDGTILHGRIEDQLIEHFRAQTPVTP